MTEAPDRTAAAPRGRPRNAAVDGAVIDTVLRLLAGGAVFADLSMVAIAREAGVTRATVYRRWPTKDALLVDVLLAAEEPLPEPAGKSLRADLLEIMEATRKRSLSKETSALMRNMTTMLKTNPELWQCYRDTAIAPRRKVFATVLRRGIETGELRPELGDDLDFLIDLLVGPFYYRASMNAPLAEDLTEHLVDTFLRGASPR
ncbi:TetR/AcrR family transcriptional regulator [Streptomyces boninensis]|uniref:TetR/AcrR family transcriptional regulator n=1 Tax=Streptomyces boninensis TaxID=2039455 RepID=UPI003B210E62